MLLGWDDEWHLAPWALGGGRIGIALTSEPAAAALWPTWPRWLRRPKRRTDVPLLPRLWRSVRGARHLDLLLALCALLRARPALRPDPARGRRLLDDVSRSHLSLIVPNLDGGFRWDSMEILQAMAALGLRHEIGGRPVPGDPLGDAEELAARVQDRIAASRWARDVDIAPDRVLALVRSHHTDIAPWPFAALTAEQELSSGQRLPAAG